MYRSVRGMYRLSTFPFFILTIKGFRTDKSANYQAGCVNGSHCWMDCKKMLENFKKGKREGEYEAQSGTP
jgi:hypothetical protein